MRYSCLKCQHDVCNEIKLNENNLDSKGGSGLKVISFLNTQEIQQSTTKLEKYNNQISHCYEMEMY